MNDSDEFWDEAEHERFQRFMKIAEFTAFFMAGIVLMLAIIIIAVELGRM